MNNTFLIAYAIFILTMMGLSGTIGAETVASKIIGFVGMFLALPALVGVIGIAVMLDENVGNGWLSFVAVVGGTFTLVAFGGVMCYVQEKLDNRAKKA